MIAGLCDLQPGHLDGHPWLTDSQMKPRYTDPGWVESRFQDLVGPVSTGAGGLGRRARAGGGAFALRFSIGEQREYSNSFGSVDLRPPRRLLQDFLAGAATRVKLVLRVTSLVWNLESRSSECRSAALCKDRPFVTARSALWMPLSCWKCGLHSPTCLRQRQ